MLHFIFNGTISLVFNFDGNIFSHQKKINSMWTVTIWGKLALKRVNKLIKIAHHELMAGVESFCWLMSVRWFMFCSLKTVLYHGIISFLLCQITLNVAQSNAFSKITHCCCWPFDKNVCAITTEHIHYSFLYEMCYACSYAGKKM